MSLKLKEGVDWDNVNEDFREVLETKVLRVFDAMNRDLVITSLNDSIHMKGSLHYKGLAADIRIWNLAPFHPEDVRDMIKEALGKEYDVILEKDHIHVEFDPK